MAQQHPGEFLFGANEVTDHPDAVAEIERYVKLGACIIGEQKFGIACDSPESQRLYELAAHHEVPILLHFQEGTYNSGYAKLPEMLKRHPKTIFIGHAQTVWANIDAKHTGTNLYPKGPVTPGGLSDQYLTHFDNFYADLSAGSGLNSLQRDEEHTRAFLTRHQDKLLYGSDCADHFGRGPGCQGAETLATLRRLSPSPAALRKILYSTAKRLLKVPRS
jgi:uncharacterized protein